ncbi:MAG: hypothetical protein WD042_09605 [Phycisphaeraceae bacterium]
MNGEPQPYPRRYWWLKRLSAALVIALLAFAGLRWYWAHTIHQRLEAAVQAIRDRGEPIEAKDLIRPPVADQDNAAWYYQQALAAWPLVDGKLITESDWYSEPDRHPDPITDNAAYLVQCRPALELLLQGSQKAVCDWRLSVQSPLVGGWRVPDCPNLLCYLLADAAYRADRIGQDRVALDLIGYILSLGESDDIEAQGCNGALNAFFIRVVGTDAMERMLIEPAVDLEGRGEALRQHAPRLIGEFLDLEAPRRVWSRGWIGERVVGYDALGALFNKRLQLSDFSLVETDVPDCLLLTVGRPVLEYDAAMLLRWYGTVIVATRKSATATDFSAYTSSVDMESRRALKLRSMHPLSLSLMPNYGVEVWPWCSPVAHSHMAATALAIKLYELEHGRRPATLADLVPAYLPAVPQDPFAPQPAPIQYLPNGAPTDAGTVGPAILYSVGRDGVDQGGVVPLKADGTIFGVKRYHSGHDQFFLLDKPALAATPPAPSERPEDEPRVQDEEGD